MEQIFHFVTKTEQPLAGRFAEMNSVQIQLFGNILYSFSHAMRLELASSSFGFADPTEARNLNQHCAVQGSVVRIVGWFRRYWSADHYAIPGFRRCANGDRHGGLGIGQRH